MAAFVRRGSQPDGSLTAVSTTEQETADHSAFVDGP
jgi:hypothetical protein